MSTNAAWADKARDRIRRLAADSTWAAVTAGRIILEARGKLEHGKFLPWLESLPFGKSTAYKLVRVAVVFGGLKLPQCGSFELAALYELSALSCPEAALAEALKLAARGETVTHETAQALIACHRPAIDSAAPNSLPAYARMLLIDRLDAAIETGTIELVKRPEDVPRAAGPAIDRATYTAVLAALFPEECIHERRVPAGAIDAPPGSSVRVAAYARRFSRGEDLYHSADGDVLADDRRSVVGHQRLNGQGGPVVTGWQQDRGGDDPSPGYDGPGSTGRTPARVVRFSRGCA